MEKSTNIKHLAAGEQCLLVPPPDLLLEEYKLPLREDLVEVYEKMLDTGQTGLDTTLSAQNVLVGTEQKEVRAGTRDGGGGETLSTIRTFAHGVAVK